MPYYLLEIVMPEVAIVVTVVDSDWQFVNSCQTDSDVDNQGIKMNTKYKGRIGMTWYPYLFFDCPCHLSIQHKFAHSYSRLSSDDNNILSITTSAGYSSMRREGHDVVDVPDGNGCTTALQKIDIQNQRRCKLQRNKMGVRN
jgi:hypothetical protein